MLGGFLENQTESRHDTLLIQRVFRCDEYTIGKLYLNNEYICDTLEDVDRDTNRDGQIQYPETKIYGETAIPNGKYKVNFRYSPKFSPLYRGKPMPYIDGVPTHSHVLFHWGNSPKDTLGCVLVGENLQKGKVLNSRKTFDIFYNKIKDCKDLTLSII